MRQTARIDNNLNWKAKRSDAGTYVAWCDELALTAAAETTHELHQAIHEVMDDLFRTLIREGELAEFLTKRGWSPLPQTPDPGFARFDIPYALQFESSASWE